MNKNKIKNNKGITLVALVVTIIILIILAAVSISLVLGEHGLLKMARDGRDNYLIAANEEQAQLGQLEDQWDSLINGGSTPPPGGDELDATGNIRITNFSIAGTPVTDVPLPSSDFEKVPGTEIDNSYVARGKANTDYAGDEFVWVPVDKDQQFSVKIEGSGSITSVTLTNPVGDTKSIASNISAPQNLTGITPTVEDKVYNGKYKVTVTPAEGDAVEKTLDVYSLYAVNVDLTLAYFKAIFGDDYESNMQQYFGGEKGCISSFTEPTDNDINYSARVAANGGFWIGRYEASYKIVGTGEDVNEMAASVASTSTTYDGNTDNLSTGMLWNYISRTNALTTAKTYNTTLKSSLPTGAAWDRTLGWIYEKRGSTGKDLTAITNNSSSWGNYSDDTLTNGSNGLINTGSTNETMANNIYDLAGNLGEWSTENYTREGSTDPVGRGGVYSISGSSHPAAVRLDVGGVAGDDIGFRVVLYK